MNLLSNQNQTAVCCPSLEWSSAGSVVVPEAKPAPAVTLWPTVENTTRRCTGSTHTNESVVAKVDVLHSLFKKTIMCLYSVGVHFNTRCRHRKSLSWLFFYTEASTAKEPLFLLPESELVTEPEEEGKAEDEKEEKETESEEPSQCPSLAEGEP